MNKKVTFTLPEELINKLKETSKETMVPQSKLVEKGIGIVLEQYKNGSV